MQKKSAHKKHGTLFGNSFDELVKDEKSIDLIMRDELHNTVLMERCFEAPEVIKKNVHAADKNYIPKKTKRSKNPMFWKPDPIRYSKHLAELLESGVYS